MPSAAGPAAGSAATPAATGVNFTAYVKDMLRDQSDTDSPLPVSQGEFVFPDDAQPTDVALVPPEGPTAGQTVALVGMQPGK